MTQRLAIIGFIIAVIIAVFAFTQQQQAVEQARTARTQAAQAQAEGVTAFAQVNEAATAQGNAQSTEAAALANVNEAATAQSEAESAQGTAQAGVNAAETRAARIAAASTAAADSARSTATADQRAIATLQAQSTADLATAQAELDTQATTQAETVAQLATATAQIDLAEFAREAAEADRLAALTQAWSAATLIADTESELATAQAVIAGVTATPTPLPQPTAAATVSSSTQGEALELASNFRSRNGRLTFQYPETWATQELDSGAVLAASDPRILGDSNAQVQPGVFLQILVAPALEMGLSADDTPVDTLQAWVGVLTQQNSNLQISEPTETTFGSHPAARAQGGDTSGEVVVTTLDLGNDVIGVIFAFSSQGDMANFLATIDALIGSIAYTDV
jgi:hypothetical protein